MIANLFVPAAWISILISYFVERHYITLATIEEVRSVHPRYLVKSFGSFEIRSKRVELLWHLESMFDQSIKKAISLLHDVKITNNENINAYGR